MIERIARFIGHTSSTLPDDALKALKSAHRRESPGSSAKMILATLIENAKVAAKAGTPLCQDTGTLTFFVDERLRRKATPSVFAKAVALATERGWLRRNTIDSISGASIDTNACPGAPVVHYVEGGKGKRREGEKAHDSSLLSPSRLPPFSPSPLPTIRLIMKGGGSENMSAQMSLPDAVIGAGRDLEGVRKAVLTAVQKAQGYGCAPGILGVCIGGDRASGYEEAKLQLLRALDDTNPDPRLAKLERRILKEANKLGIGPMGLGGKTTLLAVKIGSRPRLPASFFVTVAYLCWAARRGTLVVE